jgi:hypothetical protein
LTLTSATNKSPTKPHHEAKHRSLTENMIVWYKSKQEAANVTKQLSKRLTKD